MITAILVNYHTAQHTLDAAMSIYTQQEIKRPEIIVIDNSASHSEKELLKSRLPHGTTYIYNTENTGFAKACNQAMNHSSSEFILLLNPDARLLPGALSTLATCLKNHPDAGAVGPRVYWDEDCRFLMPPSTYPSIWNFYKEIISQLHPKLGNYKSFDFRKMALRAWTCTKPLIVEALSGGHVLIRREAIHKCSGLFDERFFMYWEDTDLMHRLKKNGFRLYMEPRASCLHFYEHSQTKQKLIAQGWSVYQQKYLQKNSSFQFANWLKKRLSPVKTPDFKQIGVDNEKLIFPVPHELRNAWLLELGTTSQLIPAIGHFGSGPKAEVETALFRRLQEKTYFARLSTPDLKPNLIYYWQWQGYSPKSD